VYSKGTPVCFLYTQKLLYTFACVSLYILFVILYGRFLQKHVFFNFWWHLRVYRKSFIFMLFSTSEIKIQVRQSVVTCSCASCGFGMCTVFDLYPLVFCFMFLQFCIWWCIGTIRSFVNERLQELGDVVVFETRVLSSKLPWCTLLWPYVYFISSSFLNMLNVSEETGALGFDEYWLPVVLVSPNFHNTLVFPATLFHDCNSHSLSGISVLHIMTKHRFLHMLQHFIPCLHMYSAILSVLLCCDCCLHILGSGTNSCIKIFNPFNMFHLPCINQIHNTRGCW